LLKFQENKKIKPIDDVWKTRTVLFAIIYGCEFALLANVEIGDLHSGRRQPEERLAVEPTTKNKTDSGGTRPQFPGAAAHAARAALRQNNHFPNFGGDTWAARGRPHTHPLTHTQKVVDRPLAKANGGSLCTSHGIVARKSKHQIMGPNIAAWRVRCFFVKLYKYTEGGAVPLVYLSLSLSLAIKVQNHWRYMEKK
jgi:hypothetical protein